MNYIKSYKIFESIDDIEKDVRDIISDVLTELKDEGFISDIITFDNGKGFYLVVKKKGQKFAYIEIKDTIDKLLSHLSKGYLLRNQYAGVRQVVNSIIEGDELNRLLKDIDSKQFVGMTYTIIKKSRI